MSRRPPEPVQVIKQRRDAALEKLTASIPYAAFLGMRFDRRGDELTAILPYADALIGNPWLPALHGGATAAFLEMTALVELSWSLMWDEMESAETDPLALPAFKMPRTIDFSVDYMRSGLPRDAYARARVNRSGRRYASVFVEAWQDNRERPFVQATGHFLMPGG